MLKVDRFTLFIFSMVALVIVVVSVSQFHQFSLNLTAVDQNQKIYDLIRNGTSLLMATENKLVWDVNQTLGNITGQHRTIMQFVNDNIRYTNQKTDLNNELLNNHTAHLLQKLNKHMNQTAANLNLTMANAQYLKDTNTLLHKIFNKVGMAAAGGK